MFLCAFVRLLYVHHCKCFFGGELGLWRLVKMVPAQRSSRNRLAGTSDMKPLKVTCDLYRWSLTGKVFPTIWSMFPTGHRSHVVVQQDNARPHVSIEDTVFTEQGQKNNWNIFSRSTT